METYRGCVRPWECDTTEHFTTAFYFNRLGQATDRLLGVEHVPRTTDCYVRYLREFNKGDVFHVDSGCIHSDDHRIVLGHRYVDSATGEVCTLFEQEIERVEGIDLHDALIPWDEPKREAREMPPTEAQWLATAAQIVAPADVDRSGRLSLEAIVHCLSTAALQCQVHMGLTPDFVREQRLGFSTFEFQMTFPSDPPRVGEGVEAQSAIAHVGKSSVRMVHRLVRVNAGEEIAILSQMGVNLNLDVRRPEALPDAVAARAKSLMN